MQADVYKQDFMKERKDREAKHLQLEDVKEILTHESQSVHHVVHKSDVNSKKESETNC